MGNEHTEFWLALLAQGRDMDQRLRLWNGYLGWRLPPRVKGEGGQRRGWAQLVVDPPDGGWPELTKEEYGSTGNASRRTWRISGIQLPRLHGFL